MKKDVFPKMYSSCDDCESWLSAPNSSLTLRKCGLQDADAWELMQEYFMAVNKRIKHWELAKERDSSINLAARF